MRFKSLSLLVEKIPIRGSDLECLKLLIADIGTLISFISFANKKGFHKGFPGKKFSTVIVGFLLLPLYHSWEKAKDLWGQFSCKAMEDLVPVAEKD